MQRPSRRELLCSASFGAAFGSQNAAAGAMTPAVGENVDFRYTPLKWQSVICFPNDPYKTVVDERGSLCYGHPKFTEAVEFSVLGTEPDRLVRQALEAPLIPIVHTHLERSTASLELITFASNRPGEGRVDNVILSISPKPAGGVYASPAVTVRTTRKIALRSVAGAGVVTLEGTGTPAFAVCDSPLAMVRSDFYPLLTARPGEATHARPLVYFFRFPQERQSLDPIRAGLKSPFELLAETRAYWRKWSPFANGVTWSLPRRYSGFLAAGSRNIFQHREIVDGKVALQAGPTLYRGFWILDGHWIMEAARFLGFEDDARKVLELEWERQEPSGGLFAEGGREHWKDTAIAIFSLVRHAELAQDWSLFSRRREQVLRAVQFLAGLREKARQEDSANGRYGLLARGFCDGGIAGVRSEFTNTVWALAGLKALVDAVALRRLTGFETAVTFYQELRAAFFKAARQEMRSHPAGFEYLPALMKEDAQWSLPNEWDRPRPQAAQWALAQAICPGLVFAPDDPIVQGHIALMRASTGEQVPIETGWIRHGGLWTNQAAFLAQICLWLGQRDWASEVFHGFLNHASPLYCWREEQPLRGSLLTNGGGDMPHISATAECVRYLRNMLAFEAGPELRLAAGIGDSELSCGEPYSLAASPTRFGRLNLTLEPAERNQVWRLEFKRENGPAPARIGLPSALGSGFHFTAAKGVSFRRDRGLIEVSPDATSWVATWTRKG